MHRFYLSPVKFSGQNLEINDKRITYQLTKVLRMRPDDFFHVFDEAGEFLVQIEEIAKRSIKVKKIKNIVNDAEPVAKVTLYQAIPKKPALFELILQKATEIGVSEIVPLVTERTEKRRMSKFDRLELIALEATEQCGRLTVPTIRHPVTLEQALNKVTNGFIAYEYEGKKYLNDYSDELKYATELQLIIGPEGGLSEKEMSMAKTAKLHPFSLGSRILRTETAAIAGLSLLLLSRPE